MICLGIESTAHTFGIGIVDSECNILANERSQLVTEEGGILPREAFDNHVENAGKVISSAMEKAGVGWDDIGLVSFSQGPGLGPCLKAGSTAARMLSLIHNKPLLGVNHCVAHIEIGRRQTGAKDPLVVYASGANTQVIGYESGRYRVYGETLDTGIGNLLDSFGRAMGIGFPAGPVIDELYFKAKDYIELPYSVKGMDLAFSGLQTAAESKIEKSRREDIAYSLMHTAFAMLTEVSERAIAHTGKDELLLTGGVAASKALRKMLGEMCAARGAEFMVPEFGVCIDNGAMIAWQGIVEYNAGRRQKIGESVSNPLFRTDEVEVSWIGK
jgi:universal protein Kae1